MAKPDGWTEIEEGFYIIDQSGASPTEDAMRQQADSTYQEVKEAVRGKIKFVDKESDSSRPASVTSSTSATG